MARNYRSIAEPKTLNGNVNNSTTQITLNNVTGLPSPPYVLVLSPDTDKEEAVLVVADATLTVPTLRVQRAIETDATAKEHTSGNEVRHMIVGSDLQLVHDHLDDSDLVHGLGSTEGNVVGTAKAQTLTNKTLTTPKINENVNLTATSTELNILDGATLNTTELNYVDGVTSAIQTQIDTKAPSAGPTFTGTVVLPSTTSIGTITSTELSYIDGVTSSVQTQIGTINTALTTNTPVGSIVMWVKTEIPTGWLECNGQSTSSYTALAAVVGATVPDMRGFVPAGFKTDDDAFGTLKGTGGSKTSTATHTHNLASHTHGDDHVHSGGTGGQSANHYHNTPIGFENAPTDIAGTGSQLIDLATGGYAVSTGDNSGDHTHGFTTNSKNEQGYGTTTAGPSDNTSGGSSVGATNGNLQPYFTLKFIIKF
jgi:microcystin-dependent protein